MTLAAAIAQELPFLRAEAEARMTSRVTVRRKTGRGAQSESNGAEVPSWSSPHVDLPFRLTSGSSSDGGSRGVSVGGVTFEEATAVGHVPAATLDLKDGDLLDVTSGECAGDVFRIVAAVKYDQKTARRLPIVEAARPGEW